MRRSDKLLIGLSTLIVLASLTHIIYVDFFSKNQNSIVRTTDIVYFDESEVDSIKVRPVEEFVRRPTVTVPKLSVHPRGWAVGTGFKVSDNIWFTARHVVDGCDKIFVNIDYGSSNQTLKLIDKVYVHAASDLAAFTYNNLAPSFQIPSLRDVESTKSLLRTSAYTAGYPVGEPGNLYVKYLGKAALSNKNYNLIEPIIVWSVSNKYPDTLTSVGGISGGPMFNEKSRLVGVTVAEMIRRGTVATADLHSINWLLKAMTDVTKNKTAKIAGSFSPETMTDRSNALREDESILQIVCRFK